MAHEVGHWELHRRYFLGRAEQGALFGCQAEPALVCRSSEKKKPIEWQADTFAAYLLMPKDEVFRVWQELRGSLVPYSAGLVLIDENAPLGATHDSLLKNMHNDMAKKFGVSVQSMQIRLEHLSLSGCCHGQMTLTSPTSGGIYNG